MKYKISLLLVTLLLFSACIKSVPPKAPLPEVKIAVAEINQAQNIRELIAGFIYEHSTTASPETLKKLNDNFVELLTNNSKRDFIFIPANKSDGQTLKDHKSGKYSALLYWAELGREYDAEVVLLPQILSWNINDEKLQVKIDFYLILTEENGSLIDRYSIDLDKEIKDIPDVESYFYEQYKKHILLAMREFRLSDTEE